MASKQKIYSIEKTMTRPHTMPGSGHFATITADTDNRITNSNYFHCREQFHGQNNAPLPDILFVHAEGKGENVATFIQKVEERLGHELFTESGPTNLSNISWFKPSEFWKRNPMRRSLFTILLRCGRQYKIKHNNFEEALFSEGYARDTRRAVEHFINGHTWFTGTGAGLGWYRQFYSANEQTIATTLTKKPVTDQQLIRFALEKLGLSKSQLLGEYRRTQTPKKFSQRPVKKEIPAEGTTPAADDNQAAPPVTTTVTVSAPVTVSATEPVTVEVQAQAETPVQTRRGSPLAATSRTASIRSASSRRRRAVQSTAFGA